MNWPNYSDFLYYFSYRYFSYTSHRQQVQLACIYYYDSFLLGRLYIVSTCNRFDRFIIKVIMVACNFDFKH